ncbi:hypothetical protein BKA81DRAFT_223665 [Phyllosticta paracitricarpa]
MADRSEENLATFLQRLNFDLNLSPSTKPSKPQLKPVTSSQTPKANSGASRKSSKASPVKPRYQSPNRLSARANSFVPSASVQETPASADPFQEKSPVDPPKRKLVSINTPPSYQFSSLKRPKVNDIPQHDDHDAAHYTLDYPL